MTLKKSGVYVFSSLYQSRPIKSSLNTVKVIPDEAQFGLSDLSIYVDGQYSIYDQNSFSQKIQEFPIFQLNVYDQFKNLISSVPSSWNDIRIFVTGDEIAYDRRIELCKATMFRYDMCKDES